MSEKSLLNQNIIGRIEAMNPKNRWLMLNRPKYQPVSAIIEDDKFKAAKKKGWDLTSEEKEKLIARVTGTQE